MVKELHVVEGSSLSKHLSLELATAPILPIIHGCCLSLSKKNPTTQTPGSSWSETDIQAPGT